MPGRPFLRSDLLPGLNENHNRAEPFVFSRFPPVKTPCKNSGAVVKSKKFGFKNRAGLALPLGHYRVARLNSDRRPKKSSRHVIRQRSHAYRGYV
jgi:hypothetical protein